MTFAPPNAGQEGLVTLARVEHRYAMLEGEPTSRTHLGFGAFRKFEEEARGY